MPSPPHGFSHDAWYAIGGTSALADGAVMPARLFGTEMAVWRGHDGICRVWANRCIHRGMRLQFGFVEGDRLACRYHGWRFGGDGRCVHIPSFPEGAPPDDFRIARFRSTEAGGLIWASTGTPPEDSPLPAALAEIGDGLVFCRSLAVNAAPDVVAGLAAAPVFPPVAADAAGLATPVSRDGDGALRCAWATPDGTLEAAYAARRLRDGVTVAEVSGKAGRETLVLLTQPVDDRRARLHVLAAGSGPAAAIRRHYAAWGRRFRWFAEHPGAHVASWSPVAAARELVQ